METIIGVIREVSGHTFDIIYDLYFTEERLIAVLIQHPGEATDYASSVSWQNIFLGNTISKRKEQSDLNRVADERRRNNQTLTPSELAASHSANYVVRYKSIANLEIKTGLLGNSLKIALTDPALKGLSFGLSKNQVKEIRPLLERVLPSKIKDK
jgi:hypothetical protein